MIQTYNIFDVLLEVIDKIRYTGNVSNLIDLGNDIYTFETLLPDLLSIGKFIQFDNDNQAEITGINENVITIKTYRSNIPIEGTFKRLDPYSGQDLSIDIASKYAQKTKDPLVQDKQKFPAIEIVRDKIESKENTYNLEYFEPIQLMFVNNTNQKWTGQERNDNNYKNILVLLFDRFKAALRDDLRIFKPNEIIYKKKYIDLANYKQVNKNTLNHYVDVLLVDIENLILKTNIDCNINL